MSKPTDRGAQPAFDPNVPTPGDFRPDGSWNADGIIPVVRDPNRSLYWFIDMLVTKRRRSPETPPWEYAKRIAASPYKDAFPSAMSTDYNDLKRWTATTSGRSLAWFEAGAQNSAEITVVLGGYSSNLKLAHELIERETAVRSDLPKGPFDLSGFSTKFGRSEQKQDA